MAKYTNVLGDDLQSPPTRPRVWRTLTLMAVVAFLPFFFEGGKIVYGEWQTMLGAHVEVRTPILDRVATSWQSLRDEIRYQTPVLRSGRLPPAVMVGSVAALAVFGSLFLRRG